MRNPSDRVARVFEAAVDLDPADRLQFVRKECADEPEVLRHVEAMLANIELPVVIDQPVGETIADLLDDEDG